jgi:hypothetical protein
MSSGLGRGVAFGGGGIGVVGLLLVLLLNAFGGGGGGGFSVPGLPALPGVSGEQSSETIPSDDDAAQFVAFVVDDVQDLWRGVFERAGEQYVETDLVLFEGSTTTGCGAASSAVGPFYCPADSLVYIDLGFFNELRERFGAPGDFAQAYVIAHEFGHHVQNVQGVSSAVDREQRSNPEDANELSVRLELQADCLAGVWGSAAAAEGLLEPGDLEEGLEAAAAVGDDRIQEQATGRIDRESWTHGSSEQRTRWFRKGFDSGDPNACDTFSADSL